MGINYSGGPSYAEIVNVSCDKCIHVQSALVFLHCLVLQSCPLDACVCIVYTRMCQRTCVCVCACTLCMCMHVCLYAFVCICWLSIVGWFFNCRNCENLTPYGIHTSFTKWMPIRMAVYTTTLSWLHTQVGMCPWSRYKYTCTHTSRGLITCDMQHKVKDRAFRTVMH